MEEDYEDTALQSGHEDPGTDRYPASYKLDEVEGASLRRIKVESRF